MTKILPALFGALALIAAEPFAPAAAELSAQAGSTIPSLRPYWHVFLAYAAVWLLILGWVAAIARRLARIERGLEGRAPR